MRQITCCLVTVVSDDNQTVQLFKSIKTVIVDSRNLQWKHLRKATEIYTPI